MSKVKPITPYERLKRTFREYIDIARRRIEDAQRPGMLFE